MYARCAIPFPIVICCSCEEPCKRPWVALKWWRTIPVSIAREENKAAVPALFAWKVYTIPTLRLNAWERGPFPKPVSVSEFQHYTCQHSRHPHYFKTIPRFVFSTRKLSWFAFAWLSNLVHGAINFVRLTLPRLLDHLGITIHTLRTIKISITATRQPTTWFKRSMCSFGHILRAGMSGNDKCQYKLTCFVAQCKTTV